MLFTVTVICESYIKEIYEHRKIVAKQDEGYVYLTAVSTFGKEYILKQRNTVISPHEFLVGTKLNRLDHPNLIKVLLYFECPCNWLKTDASFILMEQAIGQPYLSYKGVEISHKMLLYKQMLMIVADIQSKIKFTHYDLHLEYRLINHCDSTHFSLFSKKRNKE
jgi:hypothetical protein